MPRSEKEVIREITRHLAALERISGESVSALSAMATLHAIQFTRVAGAVVLANPEIPQYVMDSLNGLQTLAAVISGTLTNTPSDLTERHNRIMNGVGQAIGMYDEHGVIRLIKVERREVPDVKLPGVKGTRKGST